MKRGSAALLAMIFVVSFALLAAGLFAMVNTAVRVAGNEREMADAQAAAESGMEFTKFMLSTVAVSGKPSVLTADVTLSRMASALDNEYGKSGRLCASGGGISLQADGAIHVPASGWITLTTGTLAGKKPGRFQAVVSLAPVDSTNATAVAARNAFPMLQVKVTGQNTSGTIARAVTTSFKPNDSTVPSALDFGISTKGVIRAKNNVLIQETGVPNSQNLMMSSYDGRAIDISSNNNTLIDGPVWVLQNSTAPDLDTQVLDVTPEFDLYDVRTDYLNDPTFLVYDSWVAYLASPPAGSAKIYIKAGDSSGRVNLSNMTINGAIVFGPDVKKISIDTTVIRGYPGFGYSLIAPAAQMVYNGSTALTAEGYVVVNKFGDNPNNSTTVTINNGGLIALSNATDAILIGQSNIKFKLPPVASRPYAGARNISRNYHPIYQSYGEVTP